MSTDLLIFYKHAELEKKAADFLAQNKSSVPVDIDYLVEIMGIDIRDISRLKEDFGLYGFLGKVSGNFVVFVQKGEWKTTNYATNFTIAEELAHYLLHERHFRDVRDFHEAVDFYISLSQKAGMMFEFNAKHLAGAILVPRDDLILRAQKIYSDNKSLFEKMLKDGNEDTCDSIVEAVASSLSDVYRVPSGDIAWRLRTSVVGFKKFLQSRYRECN